MASYCNSNFGASGLRYQKHKAIGKTWIQQEKIKIKRKRKSVFKSISRNATGFRIEKHHSVVRKKTPERLNLSSVSTTCNPLTFRAATPREKLSDSTPADTKQLLDQAISNFSDI
ncbi:hypothetical protein [Nitrosomonas oligotropha]|uniref:hypothetical protein n=1 Tax=Nitrosomonas oligotropha TaxID=42354 RepID=UPI00210E9D2D|nr:hypothetical protein [Nitrosomonas oligotropha]